jgi:undecaprenyl-phosphate 4-deoxy-4-formamido-L-arabinose transferase
LTTTKTEGPPVELSIVVPVHDQEAVLTRLFDRLYPVLDGLGIGYEVVFVSDGSGDRSTTLLRQQHKLRPDVTRVLVLRDSRGRQKAVVAGLEVSTGERVVTLDAGLRVMPEEIPKLLGEIDRGHDYVGSVRRGTRKGGWQGRASAAMRWLRAHLSVVPMADPGSPLRAYDRELVDTVLASGEVNAFVPALARAHAHKPTEIEIDQQGGAAGESRWDLDEFQQREFDLLVGFSRAPLQLFSLVSVALSVLCLAVVILLAVRGLILGTDTGGTLLLAGVLFFLTAVILFGAGLLGCYMGRVYDQSRGRPPYLVHEHLRPASDPEGTAE